MRKKIVKNQLLLYDAIVVLGAVMEWSKKRQHWEFPLIIQNYPGKLVMGEARAMAVKEVQNLTNIILVTGGSDKHPETGKFVSRSEQLVKLIIGRYKVPKEKMISIGLIGASHTLGNIKNLVGYLKVHPEIIKSKRLAVLCPRFQYERAKIMFNLNPYFKKHSIDLNWLIVEDILEKKDKRNRKWIEAIYRTPEARICQKMEEKGIKDLRKRRYKPVS